MIVNEHGQLCEPTKNAFGWGRLKEGTGLLVDDDLDTAINECLKNNGYFLFDDSITTKIELK